MCTALRRPPIDPDALPPRTKEHKMQREQAMRPSFNILRLVLMGALFFLTTPRDKQAYQRRR